MNRYIKNCMYLIVGLVKLGTLKALKPKSVKVSPINLISPSTEIVVNRYGVLNIGCNFSMQSGSRIKVRDSAEVLIGDKTSLNYGCIIVSHEKVLIGNNVMFAPNVMIYDHDHDYKVGLSKMKYKTSPIIIGNNVWIGANTVILAGTVIGDNCVVAAGSVLKGKYEANCLIVQKRDTLTHKYEIEQDI